MHTLCNNPKINGEILAALLKANPDAVKETPNTVLFLKPSP